MIERSIGSIKAKFFGKARIISSPVKGEDVGTRRTIFALLIILATLLPQLANAQSREKIRVALGSISVNSSVIPIGAGNGLFAKYGVDVEPIYFGGGMNSIAAVT